MIKILTISGSPVDGSSTDILTHHITDTLCLHLQKDFEYETSYIKLNERTIKPCQACGEAPTPKFCIYDDIDDWYEKLEACDCLIFGSPVYFDSVSAQAKLFIDRINCFRPPDFNNEDPEHLFIKLLKKKRPGVMVLVGGEKTWYEGARRVIAGFFKWIEVTNEGMVQYGSDDYNIKGAVKSDKEKLKEAEQLGIKLAELLRKNHGK